MQPIMKDISKPQDYVNINGMALDKLTLKKNLGKNNVSWQYKLLG